MSHAGARSTLGPLLLLVPVGAGALVLFQLLAGRPSGEPLGRALADGEPGLPPVRPSAAYGFVGSDSAGTSVLRARLTPFHAEPIAQEAYAAALQRRLGLPAGEPWRLELTLEGAETDLDLDLGVPRVIDARGTALEALVAGGGAAEHDPLRVLFSRARGAGTAPASQTLLWGRRPEQSPALRFAGTGAFRELALEPSDLEPGELPRSFLELGGPAAGEETAPQAEVATLRAELEAERRRRRERELEWYEFNRALARLDLTTLTEGFAVDPAYAPEEEDAEPAAPAGDEAQAAPLDPFHERLEQLGVSLRALLALAGPASYDLVELGSLRRGSIGPVVFRILDDRGRLAGSLYAERLRLEGSRAGRTVTLVLEDGYESHRGERVPFREAQRRIVLPFVDPEPWAAAMEELFPPTLLNDSLDDGRWDREAVRRELNRLLALDVGTGWYRLQGFGGVLGEVLTDVHLELLDAQGRLQQRFFADRMRLELEPPGIVIVLENGVIVRGEVRDAFRGGEHRIYLPRVELERWREASIPGVAGWTDR